jgi:hypothetical protein
VLARCGAIHGATADHGELAQAIGQSCADLGVSAMLGPSEVRDGMEAEWTSGAGALRGLCSAGTRVSQ